MGSLIMHYLEKLLSQEMMQSFFLNEVKEGTIRVTKGDNYGYSYLKVYFINNKKG